MKVRLMGIIGFLVIVIALITVPVSAVNTTVQLP